MSHRAWYALRINCVCIRIDRIHFCASHIRKVLASSAKLRKRDLGMLVNLQRSISSVKLKLMIRKSEMQRIRLIRSGQRIKNHLGFHHNCGIKSLRQLVILWISLFNLAHMNSYGRGGYTSMKDMSEHLIECKIKAEIHYEYLINWVVRCAFLASDYGKISPEYQDCLLYTSPSPRD